MKITDIINKQVFRSSAKISERSSLNEFFPLLKEGFIQSKIVTLGGFAISVFMGISVYLLANDYFKTRTQNEFDAIVAEHAVAIDHRVEKYENALRSGVAFFQGSNNISRNEWHEFVTTLQLKKYFPGVQGVGFSMMLLPEQVDPIVQKMRGEGHPHFFLKPVGKREQYSSILYLEPMDKRNIQAIGYDMFSELIRKKAMETARDSGEAAISGKVRLVQEIDEDVQAGFLMYLPFYKQGAPTDTLEDRRKSLIGFVYSPFRMKDLMSALNVHDDSIQFEIYDGNQKTEENLLYRSFTPSASLPKYHHDEVIRLGTRTWHIYYFSTPLFEQEHNSQYPVLFGLIGLSLYFLLLYIIVELMRSQKKLRLKSIEAESGRRWLEALLESSIDGIHILDINGKLIHYSPSFLNMIGRTAEDADDLYVFDWDHLHTREEVLQHLGSITEEPSIFESQHHRKDGSIVDVEIIARQIILGKERYIYAASRDISERKISENELRLEKETAQHYLDIVNVMIMVLDVNKNVKLINRRGCEILGYTPDEIIGKNFVDNFLPVDIHAEIEEVQEALIKSEPYGIYYENPVLSKSGEERLIAWRNSSLFDLDGNFIGILTSGEDITQIRKAQKLLSESEHFYRTIVASVNESILILEKNKIIDCNDLAVELFQTAKDRLIGKNILDFSKNFECGVHNFDFHLNTAYQEGLHLMECSLVLNLEKESKVIEISLTSFGADDDKLIMIARDITQKIENDKLFKMQARQAQMGEMISMIAHQWRQPLAIINAITSQMRLKTMMSETEDPILIENLIKIEEQSLHLSQTISEYRDFFRPDKPKETFYLSVLLKNAIHLVDHAIKNQSIDLQLLLHEDTKLTTFRNEVLQVLIALLKNALDAFDENKVENKKILIEVVEDEKFGVIAIVDNAGGIAPDIIGKIFRPYFTTKNQIHGTGLGLYMSKMIIEEHCSGRINVSSEGLETTFIIKLPK